MILDQNWKRSPHSSSIKKIGDLFVSKNEYLSLKISSAIIQDEFNYLINPNHKMLKSVEIIKIEKFEFGNPFINKELHPTNDHDDHASSVKTK